MSSGSEVTSRSPSWASNTSAASITSVRRQTANSSPAARPRLSSSAWISTPASALDSNAARAPRPRHACPTIPPCDTGTSPASCAALRRRHMPRSFRSSAMSAPLSRMSFTRRRDAGDEAHGFAPEQRWRSAGLLALERQAPSGRLRRTRIRTQQWLPPSTAGDVPSRPAPRERDSPSRSATPHARRLRLCCPLERALDRRLR